MDVQWSVLGEFAWKSLNSNFFTALLGAAAGAFAGAWASQRIADRSKRKSELLLQFRSINAAIMVSGTICNSYLGFKKQFAAPLLEKFNRDKGDAYASIEKHRTGQIDGAQYHFQADFRSFVVPLAPIESLKELVYSKLSLTGRPLSAVAHAEQAISGLAVAMAKRDAFAERPLAGTITDKELPYYYFGITLPSGHTNELYPDLVDAIHSYTNDIVFFSSHLCDDLVAHGKRVRTAYIQDFGKKIPEVTTIDFSGPKASGLFPPESEHAAWLAGFREIDSGKVKISGWWRRWRRKRKGAA